MSTNRLYFDNITRYAVPEDIDIPPQTLLLIHLWYDHGPLSKAAMQRRLAKTLTQIAHEHSFTSIALTRVWLRQYMTIVLVGSTFLFNS